jgi:hypothetical protein
MSIMELIVILINIKPTLDTLTFAHSRNIDRESRQLGRSYQKKLRRSKPPPKLVVNLFINPTHHIDFWEALAFFWWQRQSSLLLWGLWALLCVRAMIFLVLEGLSSQISSFRAG